MPHLWPQIEFLSSWGQESQRLCMVQQQPFSFFCELYHSKTKYHENFLLIVSQLISEERINEWLLNYQHLMTTDETVDQGYKYHYEHLSSQKEGNRSCFLMEGSRRYTLRCMRLFLPKFDLRLSLQISLPNSQEAQEKMNILKDTTGMQLAISPQELVDKGLSFISK